MLKVLIPVDGTRNSHHAVQHVIKQCVTNAAMEIHLLNVQPPFSRHIARFASKENRDDYHRDQAEKALLAARQMLADQGLAHTAHIEIGKKAEIIADLARRLDCDHIVMSTARKNSLTRMLEDSVTNKVLELTSVPVAVIAGDAVSGFERYGIPAGFGAVVALLLFAAAD